MHMLQRIWESNAMYRTLQVLLVLTLLAIVGLFLLPLPGQAQTASYGRYQVEGYNPEGYPQFQMVCDRDHCIGPHGKELGSLQDVAKGLPEVRARDIQRYGYGCWVLCRDTTGVIIGRPSPDYRNPYLQ